MILVDLSPGINAELYLQNQHIDSESEASMNIMFNPYVTMQILNDAFHFILAVDS